MPGRRMHKLTTAAFPTGKRPKSGSFDLLVRLEAHKQAWMVDKAQKIRKLANDILHDKRRAASATESMALNAARDTFKFIERLYESAT